METIKNVSISELHDFRNHPFKVETNMELCELMRSIEKEGVLVPLLARANPYGDGYVVIPRHRRKEAALWAGATVVPVVIRELDDDQAVVAMADSNMHRENLKPSEKAFACRMKLEVMKHQGKKVLADDITWAQVEPRSAKKNMRDGGRKTKSKGADSLAKYFPEDYTPKQKTDLIEQLLKEWYEKQQKGFVAGKQEDDDTYIMTLAAIAKELEATAYIQGITCDS